MPEQYLFEEEREFEIDEDEDDEDAEYMELQSEAGEESIPAEFRDLGLKVEIGEALAFHEVIDASAVEVNVQNGVVSLFGNVTSEREKNEATDSVFEVSGVVDVVNHLEVRQRPNDNHLSQS